MALTLPGSSQSTGGSYLKTLDIDFRAAEGKFSYYDGESIEEDKVEGIVVGEGFEFRGTVGRPTKNKGINYISETFGYDQMKGGLIRIHQFIREGKTNSNAPMGKKTYQEWRDQGMKLHRVVFLLQGDTLAKVIFSPVATKPIGDVISKNRDLPNFYAEITILKKEDGTPMMYENDNGEFFVPTINKLKPIEQADEDRVLIRIKEVDAVVNKKEVAELPSAPAPSSNPRVSDMNIEDIPFRQQ